MGPDAHRVMSFLGMDPPRQTRLRALVSRGFTPRRVAELEGHIRELATHYIDRFIAAGKCDIISDFSGRLPMDVVSEMLGVPAEDRDMLRTWADLVVHREEGVPDVPPEGLAASGKLMAYFSDDVAGRRKRPRDSLTDALIAAKIDGDRMSDREIVAFLFLMIIAGNETTTKLIGNALYALWRTPAQRARVAADPGLIPAWVEETLRFDGSTQVLYRTLTTEIELHGVTIPEESVVALILGSANRDERVFERADEYDITRDHSQSVAFGNGAHFCLGASLARLEGRVALEEIQARIPDYEIDPAGLVRIHSGNVRGYARVPIHFSA
ncbi:MAG: cytochrome P450, partial [Myxococcota bacterium]